MSAGPDLSKDVIITVALGTDAVQAAQAIADWQSTLTHEGFMVSQIRVVDIGGALPESLEGVGLVVIIGDFNGKVFGYLQLPGGREPKSLEACAWELAGNTAGEREVIVDDARGHKGQRGLLRYRVLSVVPASSSPHQNGDCLQFIKSRPCQFDPGMNEYTTKLTHTTTISTDSSRQRRRDLTDTLKSNAYKCTHNNAHTHSNGIYSDHEYIPIPISRSILTPLHLPDGFVSPWRYLDPPLYERIRVLASRTPRSISPLPRSTGGRADLSPTMDAGVFDLMGEDQRPLGYFVLNSSLKNIHGFHPQSENWHWCSSERWPKRFFMQPISAEDPSAVGRIQSHGVFRDRGGWEEYRYLAFSTQYTGKLWDVLNRGAPTHGLDRGTSTFDLLRGTCSFYAVSLIEQDGPRALVAILVSAANYEWFHGDPEAASQVWYHVGEAPDEEKPFGVRSPTTPNWRYQFDLISSENASLWTPIMTLPGQLQLIPMRPADRSGLTSEMKAFLETDRPYARHVHRSLANGLEWDAITERRRTPTPEPT